MEKVTFTVDAGIINRLGLELVAKSETAVAELIKNAYDADANLVSLYFENAKGEGGRLIIEDDGVGMTREQLIKGFMRLATTDKIHNSISQIYHRPKAGRKGIGRFSAQRLGESLKIETQTKTGDNTFILSIDWNQYETDKEIQEIENELSNEEKFRKNSGTTLVIDKLREKWSEADIKRVYRYVAELIQPNFLKIAKEGQVVEENTKEGFEVRFLRREEGDREWINVADPQEMLFNRALVTFGGYIDSEGVGHCNVQSKDFTLNEKKQKLQDDIIVDESPYDALKGARIAFKVYYFIGGDRNAYYGITKSELKIILDQLDRNGGVKLYRNGFRVPKYGDSDNDWLGIDKNARIGKGVPFNNNRLLGFVQLSDPNGEVFEESAGREGLIEKEAFHQMQAFVSSALMQGFSNFASWFRTTDEFKSANPDKKATATAATVKQIVEELQVATKTLTSKDATDTEKVKATIAIEQATKKFVIETNAAINELEMMRVLAGTGITLAEFVHEIKMIIPSLTGYIKALLSQNLGKEIQENLQNMNNVVSSLQAYTSYFDISFSKNVIRQLVPIDVRETIGNFKEVIKADVQRRKFELKTEFLGQDLLTTPMHPSEWNTILQNLYSNAKKAIIRSKPGKGKILIKSFKSKDNKTITFEFHDNGSGVPAKYKERIFDAFFTTSKPVSAGNDFDTGTGLGLYILNQMIKNRNGSISVKDPAVDYNTNISIELPIATNTELKNNGY